MIGKPGGYKKYTIHTTTGEHFTSTNVRGLRDVEYGRGTVAVQMSDKVWRRIPVQNVKYWDEEPIESENRNETRVPEKQEGANASAS